MTTFRSEIEIINEILTILKGSEKIAIRYKATINMLEERKIRAVQNTYRMGVIGITSSGKSTLINSLLNEDLLPSAVIPTSSQLVSCRRGNTRQGTVYFDNKQPQTLNSWNLTPDIIRKYGEEQSNPHNREMVKQLEIVTPNFPFDKDLILVDSPGLDAYGFEGHEQLTLNTLLPSIDFCLFITTCKTNSDNKTKSVLNTIAKYDKPVIVIQNMIDAIKPNLDIDGSIRKTIKEVAEEHRNRVQKIIDDSDLEETTEILQYSAIWARKAQKRNDIQLLNKSGYNEIISEIQDTFNKLKPKAENKRLLFIKQELEKLIKEAEIDGSDCYLPVGIFEFDGVIQRIFKNFDTCKKKIEESINTLGNVAYYIEEKCTISDYDIQNVKRECGKCTGTISNIQFETYSLIKDICNKLNIPVTQIFYQQSKFQSYPVPSKVTHTEYRTEYKEKPGFINKSKRFIGKICRNNTWGYEEYKIPEEVIDDEATKSNLINYINKSCISYTETVNKWVSEVKKAIRLVESEINKHLEDYNARKEKALEAKEYIDLANRLKYVLNNIYISNVDTFSKTTLHYNRDVFVETKIPTIAYNISKLANVINDKIHRIIFERTVSHIGNPDNIVISWDYLCLQNFLKSNIGINSEKIQEESYTVYDDNYRVFFNISDFRVISRNNNSFANVFVLISALQYGHALNQLAKCHLNKFIRKSDNLFIVVQDFQEIINADAIKEALSNLDEIEPKLCLNTKPVFMIQHENPTYNLAALEIQCQKKQGITIVHNDELTLLNNLQKSSLGFLCSSPSDASIINLIVKSLK